MMIPIAQIGPTIVRRSNTCNVLIFECGMSINGDGSPRAYHPDSKSGLDALANAGRPGHWWGLACDEKGEPFVQGPNDPAPGFFVSTTSLQNPGYEVNDPRRYIDSETVPFIVLPIGLNHVPLLGAPARGINLRNGKTCSAIFADFGPRDKIGEGSIALAEALGIPSDPRTGGVPDGIVYLVFPKPEAA